MKPRLLLVACCLLIHHRIFAQASLPVYTDNLVNGFQDWSWATVNIANTNPVQSGNYSISVSGGDREALWLYQPGFDTGPYSSLSFWINGGSQGGQAVQVQGVVASNGLTPYALPSLPTNAWKQYIIPLPKMGVANQTNCNGFWFEFPSSGAFTPFYVDTVQLEPVPAPALTQIAVNAGQAVRTADARWFGINTGVWDTNLDTAATVSELTEAGEQCLRFPGGTQADEYNWATGQSGTNTWTVSLTNFAHVANTIGAQAIITVNYGTGTPAQAAAWVKNSNMTNGYGFKYWEIGNEIYDTSETDTNAEPHDPYTYAVRAQSYIQQMKAADPNIKIGVDVVTGEDSDSNGYTDHPATNMTTGQIHFGWTPVVMSTLQSLGVTPDFAIYHWSPESGGDSDPFLLQGAGNWAGEAANLRGMISNYFGPGGTNIELLCTANNSDTSLPGKQSVSLVNAIYYADSFCQLMQTELNAFVWYDLRDSTETNGNMDPSLYGWRFYGDLGVLYGLGTALTNRYPPYFSAKLMQYFARGGDTILAATSSYALLTAYSARRTNGQLTLLVINKDSVSNFTGQIALNGFTPSPAATIYSYGMPQDHAAEAGDNGCDIARSSFAAGTNFNYSFPPYSLTLFSFSPEAASLSAVSPPPVGKFVLQLKGQSGTPYVLQTSTNLFAWTSVSTNLLAASSFNITNTPSPGTARQYWRAIWIP